MQHDERHISNLISLATAELEFDGNDRPLHEPPQIEALIDFH